MLNVKFEGSLLSKEVTSAPVRGWSQFTLISFRFGFPYLILTSLFWIFEFADRRTARLAKPLNALWRPLVHWVAAHVFHIAGTVEPSFVRDTRYLYVLLFCFAALSAMTALLWSILDRQRTQYETLHDWLRTFIRYVLAFLLLNYAMYKIFLVQFPGPSLAQLTERFGDYSPTSLMWAFIGSSLTYTMFAGVAEIMAAVPLLFRKTTTLGALITFTVTFNITIMDFSYDVSVKMLCVHILVMALFLLLPDTTRLINFFLLNRATEPTQIHAPLTTKKWPLIATAARVCVLLYLFLQLPIHDWHVYKQNGAGAPRSPLYGLYQVNEFVLAGVTRPPLITDSIRWRYVVLDAPNTIVIKQMDETLATYRMTYDAQRQEIHFTSTPEAPGESVLKVSRPDGNEMDLNGTFLGSAVQARLTRVDASSFTLVSRGFHWISETSFLR